MNYHINFKFSLLLHPFHQYLAFGLMNLPQLLTGFQKYVEKLKCLEID